MPKDWSGRPVYSVSELVAMLASELEQAFPDVWVEGEVSGFKRAASGHCYLTLKDTRAALKVVLFRTHAMRLGFEPENGLVVLARGKLSVYEAGGDLQLYATALEPAGVGALQMAFEQAKRRLMADGLTDPSRKRPIPAFPSRVGIVTSLEGAALRDVLSVLRRRRAGFDVVISPSVVQGAQAPASLAVALDRLARARGIEVVLLTRGGGSLEDLQAFNDEALARRVASFPVPVISAVGHEVDTVLTDLTADLRAPTPSVAAEMLTARTESARRGLDEAAGRMARTVTGRLESARLGLAACRPEVMGSLVLRRVERAEERGDRLSQAAAAAMTRRLREGAHRLDLCRRSLSPEGLSRWLGGLRERHASLDASLRAEPALILDYLAGRASALGRVLHSLSPLAVLDRGYTAAFTQAGKPIARAEGLAEGDALTLAFGDGAVPCLVTGPPVQGARPWEHPGARVDGAGAGALQSPTVEEADHGDQEGPAVRTEDHRG